MFAQLGDLILHALNLDGMRTAIKSFLDDADALVASWASTIANSIASAFASAVQKINAAAALLIKLTPSSPGNYGTNTTGQPSFDATGGVNLSDTANLSDTSNLMNFAQGGLTQVTGPSGTDKTRWFRSWRQTARLSPWAIPVRPMQHRAVRLARRLARLHRQLQRLSTHRRVKSSAQSVLRLSMSRRQLRRQRLLHRGRPDLI